MTTEDTDAPESAFDRYAAAPLGGVESLLGATVEVTHVDP